METNQPKLKKLKWEFYQSTQRYKYLYYASKGKIKPYPDDLIAKLRDIDFCGVPASVVLLCRELCADQSRARALLLAKAFLDTDLKIRLVSAEINNLRHDPNLKPKECEHYYLECTNHKKKRVIYDTSDALVYNKKAYYDLERPEVHEVYDREDIMKIIEFYEPIWLKKFGDPNFREKALATAQQSARIGFCINPEQEFYASPDQQLLQRELNLLAEKEQFRGC